MGHHTAHRALAIVGVGAVLPGAPNATRFWENVCNGVYSIGEVPESRWSKELYYDADPKVPDKTYSTIGGWATDWAFEPLKWKLPIPPKVSDAMDRAQKWGLMAAREALLDYGYPERQLPHDRTAVIMGNAMSGEQHYLTSLRILMPEYSEILEQAPSFEALPAEVRQAVLSELASATGARFPAITEDTMPGELANIVAGRIAAVFDLHGPSYTADAACASAMAAMQAAIDGLEEYDYDLAVTGGVDANMGVTSFVKFCKIGALSATGTRPYSEGADGFVMGEGAAVFVLKRLEDAERDGDRVYAVIRGIGGSSDGRGKGITAPNPKGQKLAIERAWGNAGLNPASVSLVEGHGTSTRVGDRVEVETLNSVFGNLGLTHGSVPLGSVKSNIGHLKAAAGAAGVLKVALALRDRVLPPTLNFKKPNPEIPFARSPFAVQTEHESWDHVVGGVRRAGASAFGFGGTNFHIVLEEHMPGRLTGSRAPVLVGGAPPPPTGPVASAKPPIRGALVVGADTRANLAKRLHEVHELAAAGVAPPVAAPRTSDLGAPLRIAIDFADVAELADRLTQAQQALRADRPELWRMLAARGTFFGEGTPGKVAFLFSGQGSQYVNMARELAAAEPLVQGVFARADKVMEPLIGSPLTRYVFTDADKREAEHQLRQTEITQPAVLTTDIALTRLLEAYGIEPDMVLGHSLGEYGALIAAGVFDLDDALKAVSARGTEMARVEVEDNGLMAAVSGSIDKVREVLETVEGYVVVANHNSHHQAVIGGESAAVRRAVERFEDLGIQARPIPVSHAFHTRIVAPASEPLGRVLAELGPRPPTRPIVSNVTGDFYPIGPDAQAEILELLGAQIASPVQFVTGLNTLYDAGARVFVEVGPKKALFSFVEDVLGDKGDVTAVFTNHPKFGDVVSFNRALCSLYAAGLGVGREPDALVMERAPSKRRQAPVRAEHQAPARIRTDGDLSALGRLAAEFIQKGLDTMGAQAGAGAAPARTREGVVITGAALGLPGTPRVFDDRNLERILDGEVLIDLIPTRLRREMVERHITRLVKTGKGGPRFEAIEHPDQVIRLAGRAGDFDLVREFGFPEERVAALDRTTELAIAAGIDALRDAGVPLVLHYKTTTTGSQLPERWMLPEALRDETGVIFASAFPGYDALVQEVRAHSEDHELRARRDELATLHARLSELHGEADPATEELARRLRAVDTRLEERGYTFDRRFLFRVLAMGHAQFAEYIGARGPNTQVNAACASTTQALSVAEDWISSGRCGRVVIVAADDVTSDNMLGWIGSGFLASGAAATDDVVEHAALPFDRRRHGMLLGMGAAALVVEHRDTAAARGLDPICEVLGAVTANSAFHGTRLDVGHIKGIMEGLVSGVEDRWGLHRGAMAAKTVFLSHETYTPARGGSAQAEIESLRAVFGPAAEQIVIANTKGFVGHPMGVGIEDVVAVKALETGIVPPVANFREEDPELGPLNLSRGGVYPVRYALRLAAGFGSQIAMAMLRWVPTPGGRHRRPDELGHAYRVRDASAFAAWLADVSGQEAPRLEVVGRTLRVADAGAPARKAPQAAPAVQKALPAEPAPTPAPPPKPAPAPAPEPTPAVDPVVEGVLEIVAKTTGYPTDLLELDLDLEADLGIDTVKQAETFAAVRERWDIPQPENLQLRDFPTLQHVVGFVFDHRPDLAQGAPTSPAAAPAAQPDAVVQGVLEIVANTTGYPTDLLELDLDLEADLGIDTVKQAETFAAVRERWEIPQPEDLQLRDFPTLQHVVGFVLDHRPDLVAPAPSPTRVSEDAPPPAAAPEPDAVVQGVLEIVAETTGYPTDLLELDLDLEADLGIDTVKQAETFAAVRERWDIPRADDLQLRDFPTLQHVVGFVLDHRPDLAAPAAPATPAPEPARPSAVDEVVQGVLEIVAETTGYPTDLLELDLDLEADLGIDTVKQAETFAAVRERWDIPRTDDLQLRDFPTLQHVVGFVLDHRPDLAGGAAPAAAPAPVAAEAPAEGAPLRRVPTLVLRPPLQQCVETDVELAAGDRVLIAADRGGVAEALAEELRARGAVPLVVQVDGTLQDWVSKLEELNSSDPVRGVFWLPALDDEGDLASLDADGFRAAAHTRVKALHAALRTLPDLGQAGGFVVAGTRMGGAHGYGPERATAVLGGAVCGLVKAWGRECPEALAKVVDHGAAEAGAVASILVEEALRDPGVVEVGRGGGARTSVALVEVPLGPEDPDLSPGADAVYLVTGAAGGITSAIIGDLARSGGTFWLLDLAAEPDPQDADLARLATDPEGLSRDLRDRIAATGKRATPVLVQRELAGLERAAAALAAIQAVEVAGGTAHYRSLDLRDADAVASVCGEVREAHGRIDVLVHAAGLEISRFVADKTPDEFALVFDVKAEGWAHLLRGLQGTPIGSAVVFSSIAGRLGNAGQTDYSAANDLLCRSVCALEGTRGIALDWTAWAGAGMATRGSIPTMMARAGIDMLPLAHGVPIVGRELRASPGGEVVVAGALGVLLEPRHPTGGVDLDALTATGPLSGTVVGAGLHSGLTVRAGLTADQPFLDDHRIDGVPVLPAVMGTEAFAEAAGLLGGGALALEALSFAAPCKLYRDEPRDIEVSVQVGPDAATCALRTFRTIRGLDEPQETVHFTGRVRLGSTPALPEAEVPEERGEPVGAPDIYAIYFHGPAWQVLERAWSADGAVVGRLAAELPPLSSEPTVLTPQWLEAVFQTAGIHELGTTGRMGLPMAVDRAVFAPGPASGPVHAVVRPTGDGGYDGLVVDADGSVLLAVTGYRTIATDANLAAELLAPLTRAVAD